jgi:hypothetical protein
VPSVVKAITGNPPAHEGLGEGLITTAVVTKAMHKYSNGLRVRGRVDLIIKSEAISRGELRHSELIFDVWGRLLHQKALKYAPATRSASAQERDSWVTHKSYTSSFDERSTFNQRLNLLKE